MTEQENSRLKSPLLRAVLRSWMERTMSDISQDRYLASWMGGIENELWDEIQQLPDRSDDVPRHLAVLEMLRAVSDSLGEWTDGVKWIPLEEWRIKHESPRTDR